MEEATFRVKRGDSMNATRALLTTAFVVSAFPLFGCNNNDNGNGTPPPESSMFGTFTDTSNGAGTVELVGVGPVSGSSAVLALQTGTPLTGELRLAGQPRIPVTGTFDPSAGTISFGSANGAYSLSGTVDATHASGTGIGPGGPSTFVLFVGGTSTSVDTFCSVGTCTTPAACASAPSFNVAVDGSEVLMTGNVDGNVGMATGTSSSSGVQMTMGTVTVEGTISAGRFTGTWTDSSNGTSGSFTGTASQCLSAAPR
jgi:hypothetical protein